MFVLRLFLIPLLLTILVEEIIALIWGYRSRRDLLVVFLVNLVTNPAVTALRYLAGQYLPAPIHRTLILIFLEILVLLAEWFLFRRFLSKGRHFFLFSLTMNAASFAAGFLLPVIMTWLR